MSHLTRGRVRSTGIGSKAYACGGRRPGFAALHRVYREAEA